MIKFFILNILKYFDFFYQLKMFKFLKKKGFSKFEVFFDIGAHRGETIKLFTSQQDGDSRRGLGFDKAELRKGWINPASDSCSSLSFGHTGFTGTQVWADPKTGFIYVFLSNRVSPSSENRILIKNNVRTNIMDIMYQSVLPATLN